MPLVRPQARSKLLSSNNAITCLEISPKSQISEWNREIGANNIEVYIHRLRKKLEPHGISIRTIHGLGYLMERHDAV